MLMNQIFQSFSEMLLVRSRPKLIRIRLITFDHKLATVRISLKVCAQLKCNFRKVGVFSKIFKSKSKAYSFEGENYFENISLKESLDLRLRNDPKR